MARLPLPPMIINTKGFTPQGEKHLGTTDVAGLVKLQLTGKDIFCPTWIYVRPDQIARKKAKYKALGQCLSGPGLANFSQPVAPDITMPSNTSAKSTPLRSRKISKLARALVCLNTGRLFVSVSAYASRYGLNTQLVNYALLHTTTCKGRSVRYATDEEIQSARLNPDWQCSDELRP